MKQPSILHFFLSHLFEVPLLTTGSEYNPELKVVLHRGRYKLLTDGAIYSYGDLYSNYRKAFEWLDWSKVEIKSCLVLGLGLGSIPQMLTQKFQQNIRFTAVEIDEVVTNLAYNYVLKPNNIKVEVFSADAASFLQWHTGRYDLICSDVFKGDEIPADLQTGEALEALKRLLRPNGILLYNRLSRYKPDIDKSLKFEKEVFLQVYPEGGYLDVDGNWMFVNRKDAFQRIR